MSYNPPDKWTEEIFLTLPDEDDRYEWKLGSIFSQKDENKFRNKIAEELGALANSFGGTLFVGVTDDKEIVGVPEIWKGRQTTKEWLENVIPTLFELRLQHFRVSKMELMKETQKKIGEDKVVITVNVFDSELAPHQCIYNKKYFYRVSSKSEPAPHHYLSFLWGRINTNMPQVAKWWFENFLNEVIYLVEQIKKSFNEDNFKLEVLGNTPPKSHIFYIDFFDVKTLDTYMSSDVGEHFLSTFPLIEKNLISFRDTLKEFDSSYERLKNSVEESQIFLEKLIDRYQTILQRERISKAQYENKNLQEIATSLLGQFSLHISSYPVESKDCLVRYTSYSLLELNAILSANIHPDINIPLSICRDISGNLKISDKSVIHELEKARLNFEKVKNQSMSLWTTLKKERIELANRYGATFGSNIRAVSDFTMIE